VTEWKKFTNRDDTVLLAPPLRTFGVPGGEGRFAVKARPRILVIDDSDETRDAFATVLHLKDFAVEGP
jgi:hypothetical protein